MSSIMKVDNLNNYIENEGKTSFKADIMYTGANQKHFSEEKVEWSQRIFNAVFPFRAELNVSTNLSKIHSDVFVTKRNDTSWIC